MILAISWHMIGDRPIDGSHTEILKPDGTSQQSIEVVQTDAAVRPTDKYNTNFIPEFWYVLFGKDANNVLYKFKHSGERHRGE